MRTCVSCHRVLMTKDQIKFCSNKCQHRYKHDGFIRRWLDVGQFAATNTKNISKHIRQHLLEREGERCSLCGWNEKHRITGHVPLEVDHIDGDSGNNTESNLRLICPNCHSLTSSYRNLNKGKGRRWRMSVYRKTHKRVISSQASS